MVERLNAQTGFASSVVIVKPTAHGSYAALDAQDGLFHVRLTRADGGHASATTELITCVSRTLNPYHDYPAFLSLTRQPEIRFIISNTTERGITYDPDIRFEDQTSASFPAKLTVFLYERYQCFQGDPARGCIVLPCELIEGNGAPLQDILRRFAQRWELAPGFSEWLDQSCLFCNTLVDRIVSGFPQGDSEALFAPLGFTDRLVVEGE